jgi:uncharacterized protein YkwD
VKNWFLPTKENGYRAKLISNPALIGLAAVMMFLNQLALPQPAAAATQGITPSRLLTTHNVERRKFDLAPLKISNKLSVSAQKKAKAMLQANCWSHYCPEGKSPWDFFAEADYTYLVAGENLAEGFHDIANLMNAWMNSPTHRENILRKEYEEVGFGIVSGDFQGKAGNVIIAVHFATPKPNELNQLFGTNDGDLVKPEILKPVNNHFTSNSDITISGLAHEASLVELFLGGELWKQVSADNGIFTYSESFKEGSYALSARGRVGARQSGLTPRVSFTVDKTANVITAEQVTPLYLQEGKVFISIISKNLESLSANFDGKVVAFESSEADVWTAGFDSEKIKLETAFALTSLDKAGNKWQGTLATTDVVASLPNLQTIDANTATNNILGLDFKMQFNVLAIIMLMSLFGIDFLALNHSGLTKYTERGKSQLHIGILLIILIVSLTGALSGKILEGMDFIR